METAISVDSHQGYRLRSLRDIWVEVAVDLDRQGPVDVVTDLDALSDALAEIAAGGGFALRLRCEGGPCADAQLVVEDCALELGAALAEALGPSAAGIVFRDLPATGSRSALPPALEAALLESLARALGARVEAGARDRDANRAGAAGFRAIGQSIRAAMSREANLSRP